MDFIDAWKTTQLFKCLLGNKNGQKRKFYQKDFKDTILIKYLQFRLFMPLSTAVFKNGLLFNGISRGSNVGYPQTLRDHKLSVYPKITLHVRKRTLHILKKTLHILKKTLHLFKKTLHFFKKILHFLKITLHFLKKTLSLNGKYL